MKSLIDKLVALVVVLPPLYMLFRFCRWSLAEDLPQPKSEVEEES